MYTEAERGANVDVEGFCRCAWSLTNALSRSTFAQLIKDNYNLDDEEEVG